MDWDILVTLWYSYNLLILHDIEIVEKRFYYFYMGVGNNYKENMKNLKG